MTFKQRLTYYIIGFGIGLLVVFVFVLRDRKLDYWTPSEMIKSRLAEKPFLTTPESSCQMKCLGLYPNFVMLKVKEAEIDYDNSDKHSIPCRTYLLKHKGTEMWFKICPYDVTLLKLSQAGKTCECK
jgi:hypothetical protein